MARRKRLLISLILLLLVLSIPTVSLLLSPYIARQMVEQWLGQQGFSQVHFQLEHPGWGSLRIQDLRLSFNQTAYRLNLQTGPILLSYNPYQLLLTQRLQNIELSQPRITLRISDSASAPGKLALTPLLPAAWLVKLPTDQLHVDSLSLIASRGDKDWISETRIYADPSEIRLNSQLQLPNQPALTSTLNLNRDNRLQLRLNSQAELLLQLQGQIDAGQTLTHQLEANLAGLLPFLPEPYSNLPLSGTLNMQGELTLPATFGLDLNDLNQLTLVQTFAAEIKHRPSDRNDTLTAYLQGQIRLQNRQLEAQLNPASELTLSDWPVDALTSPVSSARLTLSDPLQLSWPLPGPGLPQLADLQLAPAEGSLQVSPLRSKNTRINSQEIRWKVDTIDLTSKSLKGELLPFKVTVSRNGQPLPGFSLGTRFSLEGQRLQQHWQLSGNPLPLHLNGTSVTTLNPALATDINWTLQPVPLTGIAKPLQPWLRLPAALTLSQGTLHHQGKARWRQQKLTAQLSNRIENAGFQWQQSRFSGLNWHSESQLAASGLWRDTGEVKLQQVTTGIELNNIRARYLYKGKDLQGQLSLLQAEAGFAGGRIALEPLDISLAQPDFNGMLQLDHLNLQQLLQLEQQPGLTGEGQLSGRVPLNYRDGELHIADGRLESLSPGGIIRYQPDSSVSAYATTNQGLAMALELLKNFHYRMLSIDVQYQPDGTTLLNTRLQGHNPDWQNGQRVDFNINIEENILQLIKALQIADQLSNRIEQRYRNQE